MSELKRTPLRDFHAAHGARLVDFAGWEMPVQYRSILEEHKAVRRTAGLFDGFRLDSDGRIWTSAADGVHCYDPDGTLIGKIKVPEVVANVAWGGNKYNVLYICGTTSLYAVRLMVNGAKTY